ncbi:glycosyl transferase family protein [Rhodoplanes sp. Z2-YC6860]|nr:glycosyl transferase family protein [Rhodoplanes sp. Z2-YC6860]
MVALEWATHFHALGYEICLFANSAGRTMAKLAAERLGITPTDDSSQIRPFTYDLVYAQHQVLPLFGYDETAEDLQTTRIIIGRLSRRSFMESGGWAYERALADAVFANSALTAEHLLSVGVTTPITVFHNAAPNAFFRSHFDKPATPRRITVVSNHLDPDVLGALEILKRSAQVQVFGGTATTSTLVCPEIIAATDLVISIGKTVQYALASRTPVYVYGHFGGPGYLDPENIERAHRFSFTGRCCERPLSAERLAQEILDQYGKGVAFARASTDRWLQTFRLEPYLEAAATLPARSNDEKRSALKREKMIPQERLMAEHARENYLAVERSAKLVHKFLVNSA